jgi:hypothetical protein
VLERIRKTGESHLFSENMHTAWVLRLFTQQDQELRGTDICSVPYKTLSPVPVC